MRLHLATPLEDGKSEHGEGPISLSHVSGEQSWDDKSTLPKGLQRGSEHSPTALQSALPHLGPQELIKHWTCTSTALYGQLLYSYTHPSSPSCELVHISVTHIKLESRSDRYLCGAIHSG